LSKFGEGFVEFGVEGVGEHGDGLAGEDAIDVCGVE
jgi:hypothetical protein